MNTFQRFSGTFALAGALCVVVALAWLRREPSEPAPDQEVFAFEKDTLTDIKLARGDLQLHFTRVDGEWVVEGQRWKPNRAMMRRIAHQLHDLQARSAVENPEAIERYGFNTRVELGLSDGQRLSFDIGSANPTGVSYYIRDVANDQIYLVKKATVDYFLSPLSEFREPRLVQLAAEDARSISVTLPQGGWKMVQDGSVWRMTEPLVGIVDPEAVRTVLGRLGSAKALSYEQDQPVDLAKFGLDDPWATIEVDAVSGPIHLWFGAPPPSGDGWYAMRTEDESVVTVRADILDPFRQPPAQMLDTRMIWNDPKELQGMEVARAGSSVVLQRGRDGWRWADGSLFSGVTAERIAERALELRRLQPATAGRGETTLRLMFSNAEVVIQLEERDQQVVASVGTDAAVVDGALFAAINDLFREANRKAERGP